MVSFRLYSGLFWRSDEYRILNRYFYDLFVHLRLSRPAERAYFSVLRRLIPLPGLAILVTASPATIQARRPSYAPEYLRGTWEAYHALTTRFPELVVLVTEPGEDVGARLRVLLNGLTPGERSPT